MRRNFGDAGREAAVIRTRAKTKTTPKNGVVKRDGLRMEL
jgi:hypothetical protein